MPCIRIRTLNTHTAEGQYSVFAYCSGCSMRMQVTAHSAVCVLYSSIHVSPGGLAAPRRAVLLLTDALAAPSTPLLQAARTAATWVSTPGYQPRSPLARQNTDGPADASVFCVADTRLHLLPAGWRGGDGRGWTRWWRGGAGPEGGLSARGAREEAGWVGNGEDP